MSNAITCPSCRTEIEISEVLQAQLSQQIRAELEAELDGSRAEIAKIQRELTARQAALEADRESLEDQVESGIEAERAKILAEAKKQAAESLELEIKDRDQQVEELRTKLNSAQAAELALRKRERELQEQAEELQLTVARQLDAERGKIRQLAMKQFAEEHELKEAEHHKMVADLKKQIDELKRKAEQGSQQTQGEVQELALEELLQQLFPRDSISPVPKGVCGGDVLQSVSCPSGVVCGDILWESKRTKHWSKSWLPKIRDDQRASRAHCAVIVTETLPEGVDTFSRIDGVWVCSWSCVAGLALALRCGLIDLGKQRLADHGKQEKTQLVYSYLSSQEFQQRVAGMAEAIAAMQSDLEAEKRSMQRIWSRREKQIHRAVISTAGMYGDLQGIIGASLPTIDGLATRLIEHDEDSSDDAAVAIPAA